MTRNEGENPPSGQTVQRSRLPTESLSRFAAPLRDRVPTRRKLSPLETSKASQLPVTNFNNEMLALFRGDGNGSFTDVAPTSEIGSITRGSLGFGCVFADFDLDGWQDLLVVNGHIDDVAAEATADSTYAQPPHLLRNRSGKDFEEITAEVGNAFGQPRVGRGVATADFDLDGDVDVLLTENGGLAKLFRNEQPAGRNAIRLELQGVRSNRDAIGARVVVECGGGEQSQRVRSGSSYLSQSESPLTFGLDRAERADRVVVEWPSGKVEEFSRLPAGRRHRLVEGKGVVESLPFKG